jgi:hypothetical protein
MSCLIQLCNDDQEFDLAIREHDGTVRLPCGRASNNDDDFMERLAAFISRCSDPTLIYLQCRPVEPEEDE